VNLNPDNQNSSTTQHKAKKNWSIKILTGLLSLLVILSIILILLIKGDHKTRKHPVFDVQRGPLMISVTESGTINYREKLVIKSEVVGKTVILYVVPEGIDVKKGDLLIKLDASSLEDQKMQQQIAVLNAEAAYIRARENMAVAKSQAESDVAKAKLKLRFAQLDLNKYLEGEYPQELKQAEADISVAKEELQRSEDRLTWSKRLHDDGYITLTELQADELAAKRKQIDVKLAKGRLQLLKEYTHMRKLKELRSDLRQAKESLERSERKAVADTVQAEADFKAKESEFNRQKIKLQKINNQIAKCLVRAPVDGMVVYATTGKSKRRSKGPIEKGLEVIEGQELIHMPTTSSMLAEVNIRESSLNKVKLGMPVQITVDAFSEKTFSGRVGKIGLLPDSTMAWLNPDLKVYRSEVYIDGNASMLRPGMTCRIEIVIDEYPDTLYIPVQSVVRIQNKHVAYVSGSNGIEPRQIEVGMDNDRMIPVLSGLSEGEKVLLIPPLAPAEAPLQKKTRAAPDGTSESSNSIPTKDSNTKSKASISQTIEKDEPLEDSSQ
jgi:HlyD family secretion protein